MATPPSHGPAQLGAIPAQLTLVPGLPAPLGRPGVFPATHPYVEECWTGIIGPTSVLLLRRATLLFHERVPAVIDSAELAASLGLGRGLGRDGRLGHTIERLRQFRLAAWEPEHALAIADRVPPLTSRQLERGPAWVTRRHQLHLDRLARDRTSETPLTPSAPGGSGDAAKGRPILGSPGDGPSWHHRSDRPSWHPDDCDGHCCWRKVPTPPRPATVTRPTPNPLRGFGPGPGQARSL
ncbi:MAG: hypothetical protein ACRD0A_04450 [Acidimicrobiales bacterium]